MVKRLTIKIKLTIQYSLLFYQAKCIYNRVWEIRRCFLICFRPKWAKYRWIQSTVYKYFIFFWVEGIQAEMCSRNASNEIEFLPKRAVSDRFYMYINNRFVVSTNNSFLMVLCKLIWNEKKIWFEIMYLFPH